MSRSQIVDYYIEKSLEEHFEIDQIRKELESQNIDDEEIKIIVSLVDNEVQKKILAKMNNQKSSELVYIGILLTLIGAGVTIATYVGLINMGNSFLVVYGPFFCGISILLAGLAKQKTKNKIAPRYKPR